MFHIPRKRLSWFLAHIHHIITECKVNGSKSPVASLICWILNQICFVRYKSCWIWHYLEQKSCHCMVKLISFHDELGNKQRTQKYRKISHASNPNWHQTRSLSNLMEEKLQNTLEPCEYNTAWPGHKKTAKLNSLN